MGPLDMPQPFKLRPGQQAGCPPDVWTQRPLCAAGFANVLCQWAQIEDALAHRFGCVAGESRDAGMAGFVTAPNPEFWMALTSVENLHLRVTIIKGMLQRFPKEIQDKFEALAVVLRDRAGERNTLAHGIWFVAEPYPDDILLAVESDFVRYTVKDFTNVLQRMTTALWLLHELASECSRWKMVKDKA